MSLSWSGSVSRKDLVTTLRSEDRAHGFSDCGFAFTARRERHDMRREPSVDAGYLSDGVKAWHDGVSEQRPVLIAFHRQVSGQDVHLQLGPAVGGLDHTFGVSLEVRVQVVGGMNRSRETESDFFSVLEALLPGLPSLKRRAASSRT
jgi:hypothetical protein